MEFNLLFHYRIKVSGRRKFKQAQNAIPYRSLEFRWIKHDLRVPWIDCPHRSPYWIIIHIKGKNKVTFDPAFQALIL